jgi:hypothetical protein
VSWGWVLELQCGDSAERAHRTLSCSGRRPQGIIIFDVSVVGDSIPYKKEHEYIVIGPLRMEQYEYLKTITFYVNSDRIGLLITGAEYHSSSASYHPVTAAFGTGCGQIAAMFDDFNTPRAVIGGTDIAMRPYLPCDTLAYTVTKSMFEQLCHLDESSFLYKSFWSNVKRSRKNQFVSKGIKPCKSNRAPIDPY